MTGGSRSSSGASGSGGSSPARSDNSKDNTASTQNTTSAGTIAGAVVGGIVGLALLLVGAFFLFRRHQAKKTPKRDISGLVEAPNTPSLPREPVEADSKEKRVIYELPEGR